MLSPKLSIIILSFNVEKQLHDCLKSLFATKTKSDNWEIIVVDNDSLDNSVAMVKKCFPQVKLFQNTHNAGFAAGNNFGVKQATGKYVLFLNPDTTVLPNSIQTVFSYLISHPDVGAATCRVELPDGTLDYSSHRGFPTPLNSFLYFFTKIKNNYDTSNKIPNIPHEIDSLTGAFFMLSKKIGDEVGWWDEDYFFNGEDLDFCYRIKQTGKKIVFIPEVKIIHYKGSSSGLKNTAAVAVPRSRKIKTAIAASKAMTIFYKKHYASAHTYLFNLFIYLGIEVLRLLRIIKVYLSF